MAVPDSLNLPQSPRTVINTGRPYFLLVPVHHPPTSAPSPVYPSIHPSLVSVSKHLAAKFAKGIKNSNLQSQYHAFWSPQCFPSIYCATANQGKQWPHNNPKKWWRESCHEKVKDFRDTHSTRMGTTRTMMMLVEQTSLASSPYQRGSNSYYPPPLRFTNNGFLRHVEDIPANLV